jgi:hypothetical protein
MRHLADVVVDDRDNVVGNTKLKALCGATGSNVLPAGTPSDGPDVCPQCLALAGRE